MIFLGWGQSWAKATKNNTPQQRDLLYAFIVEHPDCSASEIKKNRSLSQSSVNRILAQLKKEGLIEYVGSKKTGGYRAIDKPKPDNDPNLQSV